MFFFFYGYQTGQTSPFLSIAIAISISVAVASKFKAAGVAYCRYMDKIEPGKIGQEEVTRESLIAISYSVPDQKLASQVSSENLGNQKFVEVDYDGADKYRSELISISNSQSPDAQGLPGTFGES
ncbi:uncharacterized protein LOC126688052 [Mercurialis annua]|uniref:uncharacterized protein LOC126688052 n=1 Tax=Mercurialis annua TaxID=3986 RepID=UPI00215FE184|nr:uncharacterized protein LOC126688052 [Mercurialis annua]